MRHTTIAVTVALLLVLAGCGTENDTQPESEGSGVRAEAERAKERWAEHGSSDYSFTLTASCGERSLLGEFHVRVADGEVVAVDSDMDIDPATYQDWGGRTIEGYLDLLASIEPPAEVEASFDEQTGMPTRFAIDHMPEAIDDEECGTLTDYRPADPGDSDPEGSGEEADDPRVSEAITDLADRLDAAPAPIEVVSYEAVTWRDGSIGCPEPGMGYTQALVEGHRLVLGADGEEYHYHAAGEDDFFYCAEPVEPYDHRSQ